MSGGFGTAPENAGRGRTWQSGFDSTRSVATTKTNDAAAIAFGGATRRSRNEVQSGPALFCKFPARFAAGFGFAIELLRNGRGSADVAQAQDFHFEVSAVVFNREKIPDPDFAGGAEGLMIGFDAPQFTRFPGECARFEEARGPKPFVEANPVHISIVAVEYAVSETVGESS